VKGIYLEIEGETKEQLWGNLLSLVSYACESKQRENHEWPDMVATNDGLIKIVNRKAAGNDGFEAKQKGDADV